MGFRIGWLECTTIDPYPGAKDAFRAELQDKLPKLTEPADFEIVTRSGIDAVELQSKADALADPALPGGAVDAIVVAITRGIRPALAATNKAMRKKPLVLTFNYDAIVQKLISDNKFDISGPLVVGPTMQDTSTIQYVSQVVEHLLLANIAWSMPRRVAVLYFSNGTIHRDITKPFEISGHVGDAIGTTLNLNTFSGSSIPVTSTSPDGIILPIDIDTALHAVGTSASDAMIVVGDPSLERYYGNIGAWAYATSTPTIGMSRWICYHSKRLVLATPGKVGDVTIDRTKTGGLLAFGPVKDSDPSDEPPAEDGPFRVAARFVRDMLVRKAAKPAATPEDLVKGLGKQVLHDSMYEWILNEDTDAHLKGGKLPTGLPSTMKGRKPVKFKK